MRQPGYHDLLDRERALDTDDLDDQALAYAERWCDADGNGWSVEQMLGRGGTAPVFLVRGPSGPRALKLLDQKFSEGELGRQTELRIDRQVALGQHGCPTLVVCHAGGRFEDRLFLLMDCAEGQELEKRLAEVPRSAIRGIVNQIAEAAIFLRSRGFSHRDIKSANVFISDDFLRATLLDMSVLRDVHDPLGDGTDHGNQLPVVATSRYTPPEYLFRLQAPSPELWHGVDVYQLGGLLHDLIMRAPMFDAEYASSSENRYRFAWIVATTDPYVRADDVDADLVLLARRALDKNWERRRLLRLEDFLLQSDAQVGSLAAIGLSPTTRPTVDVAPGVKPSVARDLARSVEENVMTYLKEQGIIAMHASNVAGGDLQWKVAWSWQLSSSDTAESVQLEAELTLIAADPFPIVQCNTRVNVSLEGKERRADMELPDVKLSEGSEDDLTRQIISSLGPLSVNALSADAGGI